jgi:hypothetical protein
LSKDGVEALVPEAGGVDGVWPALPVEGKGCAPVWAVAAAGSAVFSGGFGVKKLYQRMNAATLKPTAKSDLVSCFIFCLCPLRSTARIEAGGPC